MFGYTVAGAAIWGGYGSFKRGSLTGEHESFRQALRLGGSPAAGHKNME